MNPLIWCSAVFLLTLPLAAQSLSFHAPVSFDAYGALDECSGTPWTDANLPAAYPTLIYGTTVHCRVSLAPGVYVGFLTFVEPNATAAGKRVFTVSIQGQVSAPFDVFAATLGADKVYTFPFIANVTSGMLDVLVAGVVGNAILSHVDVTQYTALYLMQGQAIYWTTAPAPADTVDPFTRIVHDAVEYLDAADGKLKVLLKSGAVVVLTP